LAADEVSDFCGAGAGFSDFWVVSVSFFSWFFSILLSDFFGGIDFSVVLAGSMVGFGCGLGSAFLLFSGSFTASVGFVASGGFGFTTGGSCGGGFTAATFGGFGALAAGGSFGFGGSTSLLVACCFGGGVSLTWVFAGSSRDGAGELFPPPFVGPSTPGFTNSTV
jgi:hypothetical protein